MLPLKTQVIAHKSSLMLGAATLLCAAGIGYIMQFGFALPGKATAPKAVMQVTGITPTSSAAPVRLAPVTVPEPDAPSVAAPAPAVIEDAVPEVQTIAFESTPLPAAETPAPEATEGFACDISMSAAPTAGALVDVSLVAPCLASERVTLHHQGMMFTEVLDADGGLSVTVPALAEQALFIADFASGQGATAMTQVPSLPFYDRVAVQWKGDTGLQLHAREFGADYFADGHIWAEAVGDMTAAARGEGGFLTKLGQVQSPDALYAEVYSFPRGTAQRMGDILLSVEAEITVHNCDATIDAQTLEVRDGMPLRTRNLSLLIPDCGTTGDFLVLKNLVEDLTIAVR